MQKHGISKEELDDALQSRVFFKIRKQQYKLFCQVAVSVIGQQRKLNRNKQGTVVSCEITKLEEVEIRARFNFYWKAWQRSQEIFLQAFIQKNQIFPVDMKETDPNALSPEELKRWAKIAEAMEKIGRSLYFIPLKRR